MESELAHALIGWISVQLSLEIGSVACVGRLKWPPGGLT